MDEENRSSDCSMTGATKPVPWVEQWLWRELLAATVTSSIPEDPSTRIYSLIKITTYHSAYIFLPKTSLGISLRVWWRRPLCIGQWGRPFMTDQVLVPFQDSVRGAHLFKGRRPVLKLIERKLY